MTKTYRSILAAAFLATGCVTAADDADESAAESALVSVKTVHDGPVTLLGSYRYRALYVVAGSGGLELRTVAMSGGAHVLATFPSGEAVSATESDVAGVFLVQHGTGGPSALAIADLRASTPSFVDAVPEYVARNAELRSGTLVYEVPAPGSFVSELFVRASDGTIRKAPGTVYAHERRVSPDGKKVAYWANDVLTLFEAETGASVTARAPWNPSFDFVAPDLLLFHRYDTAELWRLDLSGATLFYRSPVAATKLDWFVRPDGKLHVAAHEGDRRPWTHTELVDLATGDATYYEPGTAAAWPHYFQLRHVTSADGRWLLDWYHTGDAKGDVWLHDRAASPRLSSTKLASGVTVGWIQNGDYRVSGANSLEARCAFDGPFVRCKLHDDDPTETLFPLADPTNAFARPAGIPVTNGAATCFHASDAVRCAGADGSLVEAAAVQPRKVRGEDEWFRGRLAFEDRDTTSGQKRLSLLDPLTGARETVLARSCPDAFDVSTTAQRLFVADCAGLHIAR